MSQQSSRLIADMLYPYHETPNPRPYFSQKVESLKADSEPRKRTEIND
jgi:hypothetical protein